MIPNSDTSGENFKVQHVISRDFKFGFPNDKAQIIDLVALDW